MNFWTTDSMRYYCHVKPVKNIQRDWILYRYMILDLHIASRKMNSQHYKS